MLMLSSSRRMAPAPSGSWPAAVSPSVHPGGRGRAHAHDDEVVKLLVPPHAASQEVRPPARARGATIKTLMSEECVRSVPALTSIILDLKQSTGGVKYLFDHQSPATWANHRKGLAYIVRSLMDIEMDNAEIETLPLRRNCGQREYPIIDHSHTQTQSIQAQTLDMMSPVADIKKPGDGSEWRLLPSLMRGLICKVHRSIKNLDVGIIICVVLIITLASLFLIYSAVNLCPHTQESSSSSPTVAGKLPGSSSSGRRPLDVVIVYAFDSTDSSTAWYTVNDIFWLVQEKLTHFVDSRMGYIYMELAKNIYRSDMKLVDSSDTQATGYKTFALHTATCTKNMASGLAVAHKMLTNPRYRNGTILLFSDGLIHKGDFFDGAENFISEVPVHTFTLGGDAYNQGLDAIAANSPGGIFHTAPVPERPGLSASFVRLLDTILGATTLDDDKPPTPSLGWEPLDVVIVYAFDSTDSTPAWYTMDDVFWLVQEKLTHFVDSCLGYIYFTLTGNTYTSDMKLVDSAETKDTGYKPFAWHRIACTKNMASGLAVAHKMINNRGYKNSSILLFSDGLIHKGDFFDGAENFISKVPVHTFTLGGNASNPNLQAIANNSPGGTFNPIPVPEKPSMSTSFSELLDNLLIRGQ